MLLVLRQEGHPVCKKTEWWGVGEVVCLEQGADLHMAQLMPLPLSLTSVKSRLVFTARWASVRLSVCLSLSVSATSRCSTKTAKRRITQTTTHDTPRDSSFLKPKISAKFDRGHPLRGRRMQVGWVKIGDF